MMQDLDHPTDTGGAGRRSDDGTGAAGEPTLEGVAAVRGRLARVTWCDGRLDGDPELVRRLRRASVREPATAVEFLTALHRVSGHPVARRGSGRVA